MRTCFRLAVGLALLVVSGLCPLPSRGSTPLIPAPSCEKKLRLMTAKALAGHLASIAPNDVTKANCVIAEFGNRKDKAADAVPLLMKQLHNDRTKGNAIAALADMGDVAAGAVPIISEFVSSKDYNTVWSAIWGLENIGKSAISAIPKLAGLALSDDTTPSGISVRNYAATTVGKLGQYDPATAGPYLVKLAKRADLLGGVCEGILWMGTPAREWAPELKPILNRALLDVVRHEAELTPKGDPAERYTSEFQSAQGQDDHLTRTLAVLGDFSSAEPE
jgi:hypothetical protein